MFKALLTLSILSFSFAPHTFAGGRPQPIWDQSLNSNVERAGILLVKEYAPGDLGVLVLHQSEHIGKGKRRAEYRTYKDKKGKTHQIPFVNFPGGKTDAGESYTTETATRETFEETAGVVQLDSGDLLRSRNPMSHGFLFDDTRQIQMFVLENQFSVNKIAKRVKAAFKNKRLPSDLRETVNAFVIPSQDLWDGVRRLASTWTGNTFSKKQKYYVFETRGDGQGNNRKRVHICGQYMRALAEAYISANYPEQIFQTLE